MAISAPIGLRYALVRSCLLKGKHVLCESPVAANAEEVKKLVGLAGEKGLVLLDGVCPTYLLYHSLYPHSHHISYETGTLDLPPSNTRLAQTRRRARIRPHPVHRGNGRRNTRPGFDG